MAVTLTAKVGLNADLFEDIAEVYFREGGRYVDMTWGRGNFWNERTLEKWKPIGLDIATDAPVRADLRHLPFRAKSLDGVILDPPYAKRVGPPPKASISQPYGLGHEMGPQTPTEITTLYGEGIFQARLCLKPGGILIIKCQDEIESGKQRWNHVRMLSWPGFVCEDLLVLVQKTQPAMRVPYQLHARKNHSYFIVHRRKA